MEIGLVHAAVGNHDAERAGVIIVMALFGDLLATIIRGEGRKGGRRRRGGFDIGYFRGGHGGSAGYMYSCLYPLLSAKHGLSVAVNGSPQ